MNYTFNSAVLPTILEMQGNPPSDHNACSDCNYLHSTTFLWDIFVDWSFTQILGTFSWYSFLKIGSATAERVGGRWVGFTLQVTVHSGDLRPGSSAFIDLIHGCCWTSRYKYNHKEFTLYVSPTYFDHTDNTSCSCVGRGVFYQASLSTLSSSRQWS